MKVSFRARSYSDLYLTIADRNIHDYGGAENNLVIEF